jgi:hypothetical protein
MLREQGAKGEVILDETDTKRPGRSLGTKSGTSMTADEHIPHRRIAVRDLGAEEAYEGEEHLGRAQKPRRDIAERKAAGRTTRRDALKEKPPTRTNIPPFRMTWDQTQQLSKYGMNPNGTYGPALGRPTDLDEWWTKRGALMSGRTFYEQNMPLWIIKWARSHELSAREAVDYAQRRIPKLPPLPEAFHESARPRPRPEPRYKHSWEAKSTGSRHSRDDRDYDSEGNLMGKDVIDEEPQYDESSHRGNPPSQVGPQIAAGGGAGGGGGSSSSSSGKTPSSRSGIGPGGRRSVASTAERRSSVASDAQGVEDDEVVEIDERANRIEIAKAAWEPKLYAKLKELAVGDLHSGGSHSKRPYGASGASKGPDGSKIPTFNGQAENWIVWDKKFQAYLSQIHNKAGVPMTYVISDGKEDTNPRNSGVVQQYAQDL